jgi:ubiquinone/menaquinone biosynthesis C-methylase UbiE
MDIKDLEKNWNLLGKEDPMWAILVSADKKGNKWKPDEFFASGRKEIDELIKNLDHLGLKIIKHTALDFGCGIGRLTQALAFHFEQVSGVDIAKSMIETADKFNQFKDRCHYYLNTQDNLALFATDSFDLIYTNIVLQHIEPRYSKKYIAEFIRILKPEGILVFQIPSEQKKIEYKGWRKLIQNIFPDFILNSIRKIRSYGEPKMEMHPIPQNEIKKLILESKAKLIHIEPFESAGSSWKSFRYYVSKKN